MLESCLRRGIFFMSDADARQKAEDHYYAALDLMADGKLEEAVTAYRESLTVDPTFTEAMHGLARALQDLREFRFGLLDGPHDHIPSKRQHSLV